MKKIVVGILNFFAKAILKKYKPKVIGITGSVGKTATKEACFSVLSRKFNARRNKGNFNSETGLPLTVIGCEIFPGKNIFKWVIVFFKALSFILFRREYPEILVLEMGADKPGDISELVSVARPDIAIITAVTATHTERFKNVAGVIKEKGKIFRAVEKDGFIIVNSDREEVVEIAEKCDAKKIYIGASEKTGLNIKALEISISLNSDIDEKIVGTSFKLITNGTVTPILLKGVIGDHFVYPALFAASCAQIFGMHMVDVAEGLANIDFQPGRMRVLKGIKNTILIDDTYNSSPSAAEKALYTLSSLNIGAKKYAVLGDMLELGALTEDEHLKIGKLVSKLGIDFLIVVGERSRDIARGAKAAKMPKDNIFEFDNTEDAGLFIQKRIEEGDIVLVKGSRGMKMESVVKEIMAEPERSLDLLVH